MSESHLHAHIYNRSAELTRRFPHILVGPGDDAAVLAPSTEPLLVTVDQLIEGRHFFGRRSTSPTSIDLIARKAVARSISDIAAMAGSPRWALATAALPPAYPHADELFDAMHRWALHFNAPLVGGDVATLPTPDSPLTLTLTVAGVPATPRGHVLRSAARPGDEVWITGRIGGSLASARHLTFTPRLDEARALAEHLREHLHAMIDLSDGLGRDAARIADASRVRIELHAPTLPLHPGVADPLTAAGEGEDYELLFTAAAGSLDALTPAWPNDLAPLSHIGSVRDGAGCFIIDSANHPHNAQDLGWDH